MSVNAGFCLFPTALGACGLAWRGDVLVGVQLPGASDAAGRQRIAGRFPGLTESPAPPVIQAVVRRVQALLEGTHDDLADVILDMDGVPGFHQRVYAIARAIPPGRVLTYGEVARQLGQPGAARAVGQALGHNPFAPIVPCHRVMAAHGRSGGFSATGGTRTKLRMLEIEGAVLGEGPGLFDAAS